MLRKDLPRFVIELLSVERSQRLYVQRDGLESPDVRDLSRPESCHAEPGPLTQPATTASTPTRMRGDNNAQRDSSAGRDLREGSTAAKALLAIRLGLHDPSLCQGELFRKAGIRSGSTQGMIKRYSVAQGLIREHRLPVGKTHISVWEPLDKAYELCGLQKRALHSKGGFLHQFICHHLKHWAIQHGYSADVEFMLSNGKAVDLILRKGDEIIFVEIAISPPLAKELENCVKDLCTDFQPDKLVILARDKKDKIKLESLVSGDDQIAPYCDKVQVSLAGNFITTGGKTHDQE